MLTLLVTGLHTNAVVGPRRVDRTFVIVFQEFALVLSSRNDDTFSFLLKIGHERFVVHVSRALDDIRSGKMRLAENIKIIDFDNERSLAASATLIAFVIRHRRKMGNGK